MEAEMGGRGPKPWDPGAPRLEKARRTHPGWRQRWEGGAPILGPLEPQGWSPYKRWKRTRMRSLVKMEAEVGGRGPKPRDPGAPRLEKAGRTPSWSLWRDLSPAPPWSQVSGLQDRGRMNSCCFKSPNMWSSVREATENSHRPCSVGS